MRRYLKAFFLITVLLAGEIFIRDPESALSQTAARFPSAIVLDWQPDPSGVSQTVTIYAVVYAVDPVLGGIPTGQVEFFLAGTSQGTAVLQPADDYAVATFSVNTLGDVPAVSAGYLGDSSFIPSFSGQPIP